MATHTHSEDSNIKRPRFQGIPNVEFAASAPAGSTNADATALVSTGYHVVTGADGTKGSLLPAMNPGDIVVVKNATNAILKVYPPSGKAINGLTATTGGISIAANVPATFFCSSDTQIYTLPLLPS